MAMGGPLADRAGVSACFIGAGILTTLTAIAAFTSSDIIDMGCDAGKDVEAGGPTQTAAAEMRSSP
jgi:hypothetical protein